MNTGQIISGIGHGVLILWVLVGGFFSTPPDAPAVAVTEVSLMSNSEFDAMMAAQPDKPKSDSPEQKPAKSETEKTTTPKTSPKPKAPPKPKAEPEPKPDANPDVTEIAPLPVPDEVVAPEPLAPIANEEQPVVVPPTTAPPKPKKADRVAPMPADKPAPDAELADTPTPAEKPTESPDAQVVEEPKKAAAPEEATTEINPDAVATDEPQQLAPTASVLPRQRPEKPAKAAEPPKETADTPTETASATDASSEEQAAAKEDAADQSAIDDALASALSDDAQAETGGSAGGGSSGPPMTGAEKDALRVAVQKCWNVGSLSSEALNTTVTVSVSVGQNRMPDASSIQMVGYEGGSDASARQAFEAARRAIIRCGASGFPLPADKYDEWKNIEMTFNPDKMRIK